MPHEALLHYDSDKNVSHVKHVNSVPYSYKPFYCVALKTAFISKAVF